MAKLPRQAEKAQFSGMGDPFLPQSSWLLCRVTNHPSVPRTFLILTLKVLCARKPLSLRQMGTVSYQLSVRDYENQL